MQISKVIILLAPDQMFIDSYAYKKFSIKLVFGAFSFVWYKKTVIDWLIGG